jgi:hypothetical protein
METNNHKYLNNRRYLPGVGHCMIYSLCVFEANSLSDCATSEFILSHAQLFKHYINP